MTLIHEFNCADWEGSFGALEKESAIDALEKGQVIYCPQLPFPLLREEKQFLTPRTLDARSKNISFNPVTGQLSGCRLKDVQWKAMQNMLARYQKSTEFFLNKLMPHYQSTLIVGRTSYRPIEIFGRETSSLKDDTRLHVDAFAATPTQGNRILRVFTNINPHGQNRHWHLGEPFEHVVHRFLPRCTKPLWGSRRLMSVLGLTKSYRSLYDHYMLQLHNHMKWDMQYQNTVEKEAFYFPPGASWITLTDCVSHAALAGQYVLEQTFYLPVVGMKTPEFSPLRVLEKIMRLYP